MRVNKPVLSIIVPVYNAEKCILRCIDGILKQTFKDFELILVNNGSTDNTLEIIREASTKDNRIFALDIAEKGVSVARNEGLKIASGKYVGFVDADDYIDDQMYECLINSLEETSADLACCKVTLIEEGKQMELNSYKIPKLMDNKEFIYHTYDRPGTVLVSVWNKVYKREYIRELFDEDLQCDEDALFLLHYCMHINKVSYTDKASYYYYRGLESRTKNNLKLYAQGLPVRHQLCEEMKSVSKKVHFAAERHFLDRCCFSLTVSQKERQSFEYMLVKREFVGYLKKNYWGFLRNQEISYKLKCVIIVWMIRCIF